VLRQFQSDSKLQPGGTAGHDTFGLLDAVMKIKHYLDASGRTLPIDLADMIASGATATARYHRPLHV
jgi:hypothetical protein